MLFAIILLMFSIWLYAFYPILMSPDSWGYLQGWLTGEYNSFRSPVYAFSIFIICSLAPTVPEVLWIAVVQILIFTALITTILMYLHKKGIRMKYIVPFAVILPLIPSLGLHTIVVWVDLACGMSILWLTYVLVRILDEVVIHKTASKKQRHSFYIQLCVSLVLTYFIRSNSFLVYLVVVPILAFIFIKWKQWKLLISIAVSFIIILLIQFPGYNALDVRHGGNDHVRYFAAMHDIQATYYAGGRLSEQTLATLKKHITKLDDPSAKEMFRPDWVSYEYDVFAYDMTGLTTRAFISAYIDGFINNPFKMMRSMLYRVRAYWVIDAKGHVSIGKFTEVYNRSTASYTTDIPELNVYKRHGFLTNIMDKYIIGTTLPVPAIFLWRFGVWTALMVISAMTLILQKRYIWILAYLPVFVYLLTLYMTSGWTDYRYGLPVLFVGMFLPFTLLLLNPENIDKEKA
jgi:hypothetical protein